MVLQILDGQEFQLSLNLEQPIITKKVRNNFLFLLLSISLPVFIVAWIEA
jgi:hypothetical protein